MKKHFFINTILVVTFIILDPIFNYLRDWTNVYSLGAEIVLGMLTPILFCIFVLVAFCSIIYSFVKCYVNKDIKKLLPNIVFVIGVVAYALLSDSNSFWIGLVDFYVNARYRV